MEKFNNKTAIWGDQNEKYLRSVVLYHDPDDEYGSQNLYYTKDFTEENKVYSDELYDMFKKGVVMIESRSGDGHELLLRVVSCRNKGNNVYTYDENGNNKMFYGAPRDSFPAE